MTGRVLIVDDEPDIRELLEITLGRMSLITESASDLASAFAHLRNNSFSLCLTDMRLPDGDGIKLVEHIQRQYSHMPVAVITAHGNAETAIKALKAGAFDFVSKPVDLQKLRDLVLAAIKLSTTPTPSHSSHTSVLPETVNISGKSEKIRELRQQISRLARSQAPVFISGESGSGKELAARSIHLQSARADSPFIAVNCGAIPSELMESELFGHVKGSFTGADKDKTGLFQAASGGTLFLDEVASHKNLVEEVNLQRFRQDLYYRINVIELAVPSLRERSEDIPDIAEQILNRIALDNNLDSPPSIGDDAMAALCRYPFPGNVRELENILQRALTLSENKRITARNLDLTQQNSSFTTSMANPAASDNIKMGASGAEFSLGNGFSLEQHLENIEKRAIELALLESRWNKTAAAELLGMSFRSLRYRMKKLNLE